jgi:hypothetical protein
MQLPVLSTTALAAGDTLSQLLSLKPTNLPTTPYLYFLRAILVFIAGINKYFAEKWGVGADSTLWV